MRRTNAESPDTFTAKLGFFDRTFAPHTDRLGVSCRVQANALIETISARDAAQGYVRDFHSFSEGSPRKANQSEGRGDE